MHGAGTGGCAVTGILAAELARLDAICLRWGVNPAGLARSGNSWERGRGKRERGKVAGQGLREKSQSGARGSRHAALLQLGFPRSTPREKKKKKEKKREKEQEKRKAAFGPCRSEELGSDRGQGGEGRPLT